MFCQVVLECVPRGLGLDTASLEQRTLFQVTLESPVSDHTALTGEEPGQQLLHAELVQLKPFFML